MESYPYYGVLPWLWILTLIRSLTLVIWSYSDYKVLPWLRSLTLVMDSYPNYRVETSTAKVVTRSQYLQVINPQLLEAAVVADGDVEAVVHRGLRVDGPVNVER